MNRKDFLKAGLVMIGGVWVPKQQGATIIVRGPRTPAAAGGAWIDITTPAATNANDATLATIMVWDAITLTAGTATKIRAYIRSYSTSGGLRLGLYTNGGTLLDSGTVSVTGTGYVEVTINTAVSAASHYVAKIPEGNSDFGVGYDNTTGTADYNAAQTAYTLPGTLPASDGGFTGTYAFGVWVQ